MKKALLISAIVILIVPVAAWAMYKPVRVLAPEWVRGVSCLNPDICIDDGLRSSEAIELYESALNFVVDAVGPFQKTPRVVFCTTEACFQSFGFDRSSASAVGKYGIVVGPRGWKDYYLRHEMIHIRQAEELGVFFSLLFPEWFVEGMAYSLSVDPRQPLSEPWEQYRITFYSWFQNVGKNRLWIEAGKL